MAYGILKCDTITFTDGGIDKSVSISGLVQNPTFSGNITVTGTISGNTVQGQTVSGITVTGTTAQFTSGTFTSITGGTATITSGVFASGTAAAPTLTFTGDPNTGMYSPGADQLALSTNGTGRLFVDASGSTTLIGSMPLQIGNNTADASLKSARIAASHFTNAEEPVALIGALSTSTDGSVYIGGGFSNVNAATDIRLLTAANNTTTIGTERLRIDSSGRLLVGTSSDSGGALLQVNGNRIRVATAKTPASASDTGTTGEICWDASYIYVCTATNTWKRAALSTW